MAHNNSSTQQRNNLIARTNTRSVSNDLTSNWTSIPAEIPANLSISKNVVVASKPSVYPLIFVDFMGGDLDR